MGLDPSIVQNAAARAEALTRQAPSLRLDPALVQRIAQKVPIFAGMSQDALLTTLATGEHYTVRQGEVLFREGDMGNSFYVLIAGEVAVEKLREGKPVELTRLGSGECLGEMALVGNDLRSATVRALGDTVAMRFYRELIDASPESAAIIYRNIARTLAARLGESSVVLADLKRRDSAA